MSGHDDASGLAASAVEADDDALMDPQHSFGTDERRMHVRAYNYWAKLLGNRTFPSIEDLDPENIEDFGPNSVLLDFTSGIENPAIPFIGQALRDECELDDAVAYLDEVPGRSLLSRITDHYLQILGNQAPVGFEAEYVNQRGSTIMYRGILLPFSSDDDTIDFVYGVINWKELADQATTDALILQIDQVVKQTPRKSSLPVWEEGPEDSYCADDFNLSGLNDPMPVGDYTLYADDADGLGDIGFGGAPVTADPVEPALAETAAPAEDAALADLLAFARGQVSQVLASEDRSRTALYAAISRAHDFALAARARPDDYAELLKQSGIAVQARAPMTPLVKLVFGSEYDKTRLTEYACVLGYAMRKDVPFGGLAQVLAGLPGGLKAIVQEERALRRKKSQDSATADKAEAVRRKLRTAPVQEFASLDTGAAEFVVLVARRDAQGALGIIGVVDDSDAATDKILRKLAR
ncbi:hypothetical protein [Blastomonas sp.]|uniref:PAS domain-containing protein n=1 Tax=Blastomonas sp. TaxID=1909299 RepID=UPI0035937F08